MVTRRNNAAAEAASADNEQDLPGVPAGVAADVTVKYKTLVEPKPVPQNAREDSELDELALAYDNPPDPLSEFLERWSNYAGYNCMVLRLPDPSTRRPPMGTPYVRPHLSQPEQLGAMTFDPNPINFISALQFINGNSGGCFQLWLTDNAGGRIQDAVLYSVAIADPPRNAAASPAAPGAMAVAVQPREREKSESERALEQAKDKLFNAALERALNPTPAAPAAGNGLSPEQNAQLFLLGQTDFLGNIFGKMSELASAAGNAVKEDAPSGWKDRAIDAGLQLVSTNPQIVERLSGTLERIIARVLPDPRLDTPLPPAPAPPSYYQAPPQPQPAPAPQPAGISDLPEAPDADDNDPGEDENIDMLEDLIVLFNSNKPLSLDSPVVHQLLTDYPVKAKMALRLIASQPLDDIIVYVKAQGGPLITSLLDGASGPHLRARMADFKQLCEDGARKARETQAQTQAPAPAADPAAAAQQDLNEREQSTR